MGWTVAALAIIGAGLELFGLWWTVQDLLEAAKALKEYDKVGHNLWLAAFPAHGRSSGSAELSGPEPSVEERLSQIEGELRDLPGRFARLEDWLRDDFQKSIRVALEASENTLNDRITKLRDYVIRDRSISTGSRWWRGPVVVAFGVLLSCVGDVIGALR